MKHLSFPATWTMLSPALLAETGRYTLCNNCGGSAVIASFSPAVHPMMHQTVAPATAQGPAVRKRCLLLPQAREQFQLNQLLNRARKPAYNLW